ncbi:hypothetical protein COW36_19530 [bacterium (Candidatus Blackallbacteria) CG17_big_fil_post_rev_8_21_14_2_50_48_46]|uniref:WGR domain-containing protein n=1 Tax=bacterium (Candidatus Blackallbacteria) CG17_big_fil_post_rev_8_21_14_2_50_48_46 TaxID=2014261 RepID=A0A2M7FZL1_9BACT|nr:MAG: hypothetical protein COW64_15765 [bacterium (Candidatus Blackallbacteria) CG18_big_fil_WC_8_21_14_2_50_49_26]PIW14844.1 MAG: hypothetical protein COW36_19530 [bacterium (Candidatus Blackallbacteria) CG17_big_fil_post_rev_8_21_14_2_50_48_46]PIW44411.1 MAG: hypothetical protein COW20_24105 [bacterium (Candidatus Blackallbacteria) CG13_big_fil_rev_8_21_14_2_50_49_14]
MIRLEFKAANSEKFWQISRENCQVLIEWGRIGSAGQKQIKVFADPKEAEKFLQSQLKSKEKKGYLRVSESQVIESDLPEKTIPPLKQPLHKPKQKIQSTPVLTESHPNSSPASEFKLSWTPSQRAKKLEFRHLNFSYPLKIVPLKAPTDLTQAWKKLAPEIDKQLQICVPPQTEAWQALASSLRRKTQEVNPPQPSFEEAAVMLALSQRRESVDFLWQQMGPETTVRAWMRSRSLKIEARFVANVGYQTLLLESSEPFAFQTWDLNEKNLALRLHLDSLKPQDYLQLTSEMNAEWKQFPPALQGALCQIFWQQREWIEACSEAWLKQPDQPLQPLWEAGWLLWPLVQEPLLLAQFNQKLAKQKKEAAQGLESFSQALEPWVFHFLDRAQANAIESLKAWILIGKKAGLRKAAAEALCLIESPHALRVLIELLKNKDAAKLAHARLSSQPLQAIPELISVLEKKHSLSEAERLLTPLLRACTEAEIQSLKEKVGASGGAWFEQSLPAPERTSDTLPAFFTTPPWKKTPFKWPSLTQLRIPETPARMDWSAYTPEPHRELSPYLYDPPPLSNRRDPEMLERFAGFERVMLHHLDWLSEPAALDFWNHQDPQRWNAHEKDSWQVVHLSRRFGLAGLPGLLRYLERFPQTGYSALVCYDSPLAVPALLKGLVLPAQRQICRRWFLSHPATAFRGLIPLSLNPDFKLQPEALRAMHWLIQAGFCADFETCLKTESSEVETEIKALIAQDPLQILPAHLPRLPAFWKPERLPRPQLKSGGTLPLEALETLALSLKLSDPCLPYAGLAEVSRLCTPASLEDFALNLFELWLGAGGSLKEEWAFWALAAWGNEKAIRCWVPRLEKWPGERAAPRAMVGLEILYALGPETSAWSELHRLSLKTKFPSLLEKAREWVKIMAATDPQGPEGLADRLVPVLGLELTQSETLSSQHVFNGNVYQAIEAPQAQWQLQDSSGKCLTKPPAEAAKSELKTWSEWLKSFQKQKAHQLLRLEQAMTQGRRWDFAFFEQVFLKHPLLFSLAKSWVWGMWEDPEARPVTLFRVVHGPSGLTCDRQPIAFPPKAWIGLPHPLEMLPQLQSWQSEFNKLEIEQTLAQLNRSYYFCTPQMLEMDEFSDLKGRKVASARLLKLISSKGWEAPKDSEGLLVKNLGRGLEAEITLEYLIWALKEYPETEVIQVRVHKAGEFQNLKLSALHPVSYSELRRDLESLIS